jgi:hypothetical protein
VIAAAISKAVPATVQLGYGCHQQQQWRRRLTSPWHFSSASYCDTTAHKRPPSRLIARSPIAFCTSVDSDSTRTALADHITVIGLLKKPHLA